MMLYLFSFSSRVVSSMEFVIGVFIWVLGSYRCSLYRGVLIMKVIRRVRLDNKFV